MQTSKNLTIFWRDQILTSNKRAATGEHKDEVVTVSASDSLSAMLLLRANMADYLVCENCVLATFWLILRLAISERGMHAYVGLVHDVSQNQPAAKGLI